MYISAELYTGWVGRGLINLGCANLNLGFLLPLLAVVARKCNILILVNTTEIVSDFRLPLGPIFVTCEYEIPIE